MVKVGEQIGKLIRKQVKAQIEDDKAYADSRANTEICYIWGNCR